MITLRCAAGSDVGLERSVNEDSAYVSRRLAAVADGMGGHARGDIASAVVIESIARMDRSCDRILGGDLQDAVRKANRKIASTTARDSRLTGMGSTLTALSTDGRRITLTHIGDSRAYVFRNGRLIQLTEDHTYVQRLVEDGRITTDQATYHPQRSALLRVLNGGKMSRADISVHAARPADRYLLCSDGLSGVLSEQQMVQVIASQPAEFVVRQLIGLAREEGGPDNITCIVADAVESDNISYDRATVVTLGAVTTLRPGL